MANQQAITAMAPTWEKDMPEDRRPIFRSLITSPETKGTAAGFPDADREKAKPASIAGLLMLNPQLKRDDLNSLASDIHDMFLKLSERNPTEFEQKMQAVRDADPVCSDRRHQTSAGHESRGGVACGPIENRRTGA